MRDDAWVMVGTAIDADQENQPIDTVCEGDNGLTPARTNGPDNAWPILPTAGDRQW